MLTLEEERKLEAILTRGEPKFIRALELYYSNFGTQHSKTFNQSAHEAGVNPAFLVNYMFFTKAYVGMPDDREEAEVFLDNLREYKKSIGL